MINDNILFQKVEPADYEALTKIMKAAFDEDTRIHTESTVGGPTGYDDGRLVTNLNMNENFENYKVICGDQLVGAFTVEVKENHEYSLEILYIDPACRGNRIGTTVWSMIEGQYKEAEKWTLETPSYSTRNHAFYTKNCGFARYEEKTYDNGGKSIIFEKKVRG